MKSIRYIILLLILLVVGNLFAGKPFKVLEEDDNHLLIEFTLPEYEIESVETNGNIINRIKVDDSYMSGDEGYPLIPYFSEVIGLPVDGDMTLALINSNDKLESNVSLEFAMKATLKGDSFEYEPFINSTFSQQSYFPQQILRKNEPGFAGDRHFCGFVFFPFSYNHSSRSLRVIESAQIRIDIRGDKSANTTVPLSRNYLDRTATEFFLNNSTSSKWRKERDIDDDSDCQIERNPSVDVIQIWVSQDGIYKITKSYLLDALREAAYDYQFNLSFDIDSIDPRYLEISDKDGVIPIRISGENDGSFDSGDYIEFWGEMNHGDTCYFDDFTNSNVYKLYLSATPGARFAVENGGLLVNQTSGLIRPDAFEETIQIEKQMRMDNLSQGWAPNNRNFSREDLWFWDRIMAPNLEIFSFDLQYPIESSIRTFNAEVCLYGLTYYDGELNNNLPLYDHHAVIRLNSTLIDNDENGIIEYSDTYWSGQKEKKFKNYRPLANSSLYHGSNNLYVSLPGDTQSTDKEVVLLDYLKLKYWREFKTDTDFIKFSKPSNRPFGLYQFEIDGFSNPEISVYKLGTAIVENIQITPFSETSGAPYMVTFQDSIITDVYQYVALSEEQKLVPDKITPDYPSYLKSHSNRADLVAITVNDFLGTEGLENFQAHWDDLGLIAKVIDVQDIYDEFSFGITNPQAIKDFLSYAYNNWQYPQLKYAVLIGDGTINELDNGYLEQYNLIPIKKVWTYAYGATAFDSWYGCVVGTDDVPEIIVSRIPARTADEIQNVYDKTEKYLDENDHGNPWRGRVTLASGGSQGGGNDLFSQQEETIRKYGIPDEYYVTRVYGITMAPTPSGYYGTTSKLKNSIADGLIYLQFIGHGGGRIWADFNLMNFRDVNTLTNEDYFFVSSLSCFGAAYDASESCINEGFVLGKDKGAVGAFGFSGVGYVIFDLKLGMTLTKALFSPNFNSVGEVYNYTLASYYANEPSTSPKDGIVRAFNYLGDPSIPFHKLKSVQNITTDKEIYAPGDTIRITVEFPESVTSAVPLILDENEIALNYLFAVPVYGGHFQFSYIIPSNITQPQRFRIRVSGLAPDDEYVIVKDVAFAENSITQLQVEPEHPAYGDPISLSAVSFLNEEVDHYECNMRVFAYQSTTSQVAETVYESFNVPMVLTDDNILRTVEPISVDTLNYRPGRQVRLKVLAYSGDDVYESIDYEYSVLGPDLAINSIMIVVQDQQPGVQVDIANYGDGDSPASDLVLTRSSSGGDIVVAELQVEPLESSNHRRIFIPLNSFAYGDLSLLAHINRNMIFPEHSTINNSMSVSSRQSFYSISQIEESIASPDSNIVITVPTGFVANSAVLGIETVTYISPQTQPDVYPVLNRTNGELRTYDIQVYDETLVDSLGYFAYGKKLKISAYFSVDDSLTQAKKFDDNYRFFRWDELFNKWIYCGGLVDPDNNMVVYNIYRNGTYALLRNEDRTAPTIEVNVAEQEFTRGGYISSDGIISFCFNDRNGIDIEHFPPRLYLSGEQIPEEQLSITVNNDNLHSIPLNYQLDLNVGNYNLKAECTDINGNYQSLLINFQVNNEFDLLNLANYPNPVVGQAIEPVNDGRTRFTYILTAPADELTMKIYTVSGRLVKTFKDLPKGVGYHEYPRTVHGWDCRDDEGFYLANGVYFYKVIAKSNGKKIEKIQKMAILR